MVSTIQDYNNNAVEQLLLGDPKDAVSTLMNALATWTANALVETVNDAAASMRIDDLGATEIFSVELDCEIEVIEHTFPFQLYGRPMAFASTCDNVGDPALSEAPWNPGLDLVVILYNMGIACQLVAAQKKQAADYETGRLASTVAVQAYTLAFRVLLSCQQRMPRCPSLSVSHCERVKMDLLHVALVNNLLFLYAQSADMQGMNTCLNILRNLLSPACRERLEDHVEDIEVFKSNASLFLAPGSLSLSPAG